jgi:hypothetical protein
MANIPAEKEFLVGFQPVSPQRKKGVRFLEKRLMQRFGIDPDRARDVMREARGKLRTDHSKAYSKRLEEECVIVILRPNESTRLLDDSFANLSITEACLKMESSLTTEQSKKTPPKPFEATLSDFFVTQYGPLKTKADADDATQQSRQSVRSPKTTQASAPELRGKSREGSVRAGKQRLHDFGKTWSPSSRVEARPSVEARRTKVTGAQAYKSTAAPVFSSQRDTVDQFPSCRSPKHEPALSVAANPSKSYVNSSRLQKAKSYRTFLKPMERGQDSSNSTLSTTSAGGDSSPIKKKSFNRARPCRRGEGALVALKKTLSVTDLFRSFRKPKGSMQSTVMDASDDDDSLYID